MNPNTVFNTLEAGIPDPRLLSWMRSRRNIVANTINAVVHGGSEVAQLQAQLNRLREQWEVAEARLRDKRQKRMEAEERLVAARSEVERARAAFQMEQQVFEQLRNQALRSAFSSSAPGMSSEAIASIRTALKPEAPASEADRTRATQAINAFIDRTRKNPAYAAELKSQIDYMRQAIDRTERATEQEMRTEADAQVALLSAKRGAEYFNGAAEAQKAKNEELRRKVGASPAAGGAMTPEEMKLLRFALHPDRKPGADELRKASAAFEVYLSRSGSGRATDTRTDDASARRARDEEEARRTHEYQQRRYAEREAEERRRKQSRPEQYTDERHARSDEEYANVATGRAERGCFMPGDILCASWGSTMTLVDFYFVTGTRGKTTVILAPLADRIVSGNGWSGQKVPTLERASGRDGQTFDARCTVRGKSISVKVHHGARAYLWDGKPKYFNTMD